MRNRIRNILLEATAFVDRPNINDNFWKWFGDSKVVDGNGDPLVVYHGTTPDFGRNTDFSSFEKGAEGIWFSPHQEVASSYARNNGNVYVCYLRINNPNIIDMKGELVYDFFDEAEESENNGFDGLIILNSKDALESETQYCVFHSAQIKSVFNQGTWNPNDSDIMK